MVKKICPKCHSSFECGQGENSCWCSTINVPLNLLKVFSNLYEDCLCPQCLTADIGSSKQK